MITQSNNVSRSALAEPKANPVTRKQGAHTPNNAASADNVAGDKRSRTRIRREIWPPKLRAPITAAAPVHTAPKKQSAAESILIGNLDVQVAGAQLEFPTVHGPQLHAV